MDSGPNLENNLKIAPYLASTVQRTYMRQQRIGERLAELRAATAPADTPAAQIHISPDALQGSRSTRGNLDRVREGQIEEMAGRFVEKFLNALEKPAGQAETSEEADASGGGPSFERLLDALGLAVKQGDGEYGGEGGGALVRRDSGAVVFRFTAQEREAALGELRSMARDIFAQLI